MLVLRRKINQSIVIGDNVRIVVVGVEGDCVKIGVQAPRNVSVYRSELLHNNEDASKTAIDLSDQAGHLPPARQNEKG